MKKIIYILILLMSYSWFSCKTAGKPDNSNTEHKKADSTAIENKPVDTIKIAEPVEREMENKEKQSIPEQTLSIKYGTSFGECVGYCKNEYQFSEQGIRYIKSSYEPKKDKPVTQALSIQPEDYRKLLSIVDFSQFKGLAERIGCPDCDDTGAAWLEISSGQETKRVKYERLNPPAELKKLDSMIHKILEKVELKE